MIYEQATTLNEHLDLFASIAQMRGYQVTHTNNLVQRLNRLSRQVARQQRLLVAIQSQLGQAPVQGLDAEAGYSPKDESLDTNPQPAPDQELVQQIVITPESLDTSLDPELAAFYDVPLN